MEANVGHVNHSLEVANVCANVSPLTWRLTLAPITPSKANVRVKVRPLTLAPTFIPASFVGCYEKLEPKLDP